MAATPDTKEAMIEQFDRELAALGLRGHWRGVARQKLAPGARAQHWKWADIYNNLVKSGELIDLDFTGRRTVQLVSPGLDGTSPTIQMSVQLVLPGEVAAAHRHMFSATRFIVQGEGAYTTVDGEAVYLSAGDYVTTPSWGWHDHTNPTDIPMVWLDIHDNPLVGGALHVRMGEEFPERAQPLTARDGTAKDLMGAVRPMHRPTNPAHQPALYKRDEVLAALERATEGEADPYDGIVLDYVNPITGQHLLPTIGARIQMLRPGEQTQPHRHTSYTIYHVVQGQGVTVVGEKRFEWAKNDCFTVPNWDWHTHQQLGSESAILFSVHNQPVLEAFDLYREEHEEE
jgi:gentisate 1,2-dioxygenase